MLARTAEAPHPCGRADCVLKLSVAIAILSTVLVAVGGACQPRRLQRQRNEAQNLLNRMFAGSLTYYESDHLGPDGRLLPKQFPGPTAAWASQTECGCLPAHRCPGGETVWNQDPVWRALNFSLPDPHVFLPGYTSQGTGTHATFRAYVKADHDCNGTLAEFWRDGSINSAGDVIGRYMPVMVNEQE
jgi:hypothetical protein